MRAVVIIDHVLALLDELRAELLANSEHDPIFSPARKSDEATDAGDFKEDNLIEVTAAAERFSYPANTIRYWCRKEGDGIRHGGRWMVSIPRLQRRLNGG